MNKTELGRQIYNISNIKGEFLLRSGEVTNEYFDKYLFEAKYDLLLSIAKRISEMLPESFDLLAGLEMGGIPIATAIALNIKKELVFVRKKAKKYGTCKIVEGGSISGKKIVIIEDVVTSGGAVIDAAIELRKQGAILNGVYCVIDRESSGRKNIEDIGLEFYSLFTKTKLEKYIDS